VAAKTIYLIVTCVVFCVYFANVVAGAAGIGAFLSDVGGMLTLFAACICFVVAMLASERSAADTAARTANDNT